MLPFNGVLLAGVLALTLQGSTINARLHALCLQPGDVPPGFVQTSARSRTNLDVARIAGANVREISNMDRIGGYWTTYTKSPVQGLYFIRDDDSQFRSARGAAQWDEWRIRGAKAGTWYGARARRIPDVHIGDEASMWITTATYSHRSFEDITVYFRRGNLAAGVELEGLGGTFGSQQAIALAQKIDRKFIQASQRD